MGISSNFRKDNKFRNIKIFSGAQLKYIAFLSMLIDHTNKALIYPMLTGKGFLNFLSDTFDILGRIAFPIFMFFLVEGFFKTRNRFRYLLYLTVFGVISEIPFDLCQSAVIFQPYSNNVMFTLALTLVMIWIIDKLRIPTKIFWYPISIVIVAGTCLLSMIWGLDIFRNNAIFAIIGGYLSLIKTPWALLGFGLTLTYNGERGKQNKILNYSFYPVHLLILGILRLLFKV